MRLPLVLAFAAAAVVQSASGLGSRLSAGMQLVYSSDGVETPWSIDSLTPDTTFGGRRGCIRMRLRTSPTQAVAETRAQCADSAMMYTWDATTSALRAVRPLKPHTIVEFDLSGGRKARYETDGFTIDHVGIDPIEVLPTTVVTLDANGRAVSRLRERFAISLATATRGTFESPDMTASGGWRETRTFQLVAIRPR